MTQRPLGMDVEPPKCPNCLARGLGDGGAFMRARGRIWQCSTCGYQGTVDGSLVEPLPKKPKRLPSRMRRRR